MPVSATNLAVPAPTTNSLPPAGRTFLFVVDVGHIGQGGGKMVMKGISDYLDRLSPDDRVGLVSLPYNSPRVDLTTNRQFVKHAASQIVGASTRNQDIQMTIGEAAAVEAMDSVALQDYLDRIQAACHDTPPGVVGLSDDPAVSCTLRWQPMAAKIMTAERHRTQELFDSLRALSAGMAPIEGPKSIVLVSEGIINDRETLQYLQSFATAAERARVTLYGLNIAGSLADVSSKFNMTTAHIRDHQVLLDGMATLAVSARGNTFDVSGAPTGALARIDAEMSGYYLLSFGREPGDREGQRKKIQVMVNWPDSIVRARKEFATATSPEPADTPLPKDLKAAIGEMLRWPVPLTDLGIDLDTYAAPQPAESGDVSMIVAASLASAGGAIAATGYEVTDPAGKVVADEMEPEPAAPAPKGKPPVAAAAPAGVETERLQGDRRLYLARLALPPGQYRLKFAAIDARGRRGTIDHGFEVAAPRAGALRMSDVFIGEVSPTVGFVPSPWLLPGTTALPTRVELFADAAGGLHGRRDDARARPSQRAGLRQPAAVAQGLDRSPPPRRDGDARDRIAPRGRVPGDRRPSNRRRRIDQTVESIHQAMNWGIRELGNWGIRDLGNIHTAERSVRGDQPDRQRPIKRPHRAGFDARWCRITPCHGEGRKGTIRRERGRPSSRRPRHPCQQLPQPADGAAGGSCSQWSSPPSRFEHGICCRFEMHRSFHS